MLKNTLQLRGFRIEATDGRIGSVIDFYFDDVEWRIRYVVVDTGSWLRGRCVLIATTSLGKPSLDDRTFPISLTRKEIRNGPGVETDRPVYLQRQREMADRCLWTVYSDPASFGPAFVLAAATPSDRQKLDEPKSQADRHEGDPHLRSVAEVCGYRIQATDGEIGYVEDFILDDRDWTLRYIVIDTGNWLTGRRVLVPPPWLDRICWDEKKAYVRLKRDVIRNAPEYDPSEPILRRHEIALYAYYGRPGYWSCETFLGI